MDKPENGTTGGFRGRKNSFYEGGLRVPALMRWPGVIEPGRTSDTPVAILDLMPTVLDILNKPWPDTQPREGETFLPHLCGQPWIRTAPLYFQRRYDHAIITQTHKALTTDNGRRWLLFDLLKDPRERYDIKSEDEERLERLVEEWERWKENGGPLPIHAPSDKE
jgi:arylsulfatase A-like enzyme